MTLLLSARAVIFTIIILRLKTVSQYFNSIFKTETTFVNFQFSKFRSRLHKFRTKHDVVVIYTVVLTKFFSLFFLCTRVFSFPISWSLLMFVYFVRLVIFFYLFCVVFCTFYHFLHISVYLCLIISITCKFLWMALCFNYDAAFAYRWFV